uniref:Peptidase S1 domain-containing protein n=1 Tax=Laticauda laticaudata TaxID=8630 RepID=A0A8C5S303_LATLA
MSASLCSPEPRGCAICFHLLLSARLPLGILLTFLATSSPRPNLPINIDNWLLAGIVSWGASCGMAGVPGVYTSVAHYADWIQLHIPHIKFSEYTHESNSVGHSTPAFNVGHNTVLFLISVKLIFF